MKFHLCRTKLFMIMSYFNSSTSESKLNNFTKIEPTMALLGIPFDTKVVCVIFSKYYVMSANNYSQICLLMVRHYDIL